MLGVWWGLHEYEPESYSTRSRHRLSSWLELMGKAQSYYELLGVSRTATAEEIRSAYVHLMKRHHPDAAARADGAPDFAALLNRCYAVLRDPVRRSSYDAKLLASDQVRVAPPRLHRPPPRRAKSRSVQLVVLFGAAIAMTWIILNFAKEQPGRELAATAAGWSAQPRVSPAGTALPLPDAAATEQTVDLARTVSIRDAERVSRDCFARASSQPNIAVSDSCVLFDTAFLYWRKTPTSTSTFPAYFADQVVDSRHNELAVAYRASGEERLAALREIAFRALIKGMQVPPPESLLSSATDDEIAVHSELREGERDHLAEANVP